MSKLVIAYYDIPGKQNYIYKTNEIKEIIGASQLIADAYKDFFQVLKENGFSIREENGRFSLPGFKASGKDCELMYEGGGNLYMIFACKEKCILANRIFSRRMLETTYSLNVTCSFLEIDEDQDDFIKDRETLAQIARQNKQKIPLSVPVNVLPFTQVDRKTSLPVAGKNPSDSSESYSKESLLKREKYQAALKTLSHLQSGEKLLDKLITQKGTESLLAVIYIDGNAMGEKVRNLTGDGKKDYTGNVAKFRAFSREVHRVFVADPIQAMSRFLKENQQNFRQVIGDGDEITIICNARIALEMVKVYFDSMIACNQKMPSEKQFSACAGIAVFHSHAPFSVIYKIAEECCENAKKVNREHGGDSFYFDYQFCQGGVTNHLDMIRERQEARYTNRPYCYRRGRSDFSKKKEHTAHDFKNFETASDILRVISRGDVKAWSEYIVKGESYYRAGLERLRAKYPGKIDSTGSRLEAQEMKKTIYDAALVYDIWIKPGQTRQGGQSDGKH